jgi:hypothetical protein
MGCGRPGIKAGFCGSHYVAMRRRKIMLGQWIPRGDVVGTARRLQALVAAGYSQAQIAREMSTHESWVSRLVNEYGHNVNAETVARVKALYDRLAMTPGPSDRARRQARARKWAPPLAWDDDEIDNPAAKPDRGAHRPVSFPERYLEMREIGYNDLQIVGKLGIQPDSLYRQLLRYDLPASAELVNMVTSIKHRKSVAS